MLYKKTVIWTDLKINPGASRDNDEIYAADKIVQVRNRIDDFLATDHYLPSRYNYEPIDPDEPGIYTDIRPEQEGQGSQGTDFT